VVLPIVVSFWAVSSPLSRHRPWNEGKVNYRRKIKIEGRDHNEEQMSFNDNTK